MRKGWKAIWMFLFFSALYISLEAGSLKVRTVHLLMNHTDSLYLDQRLESLENYLDKLRNKQDRFKDPEQFIEFVFHKTHNRYLKSYDENATIEDLFGKGKYNCLTGTAIYAIIFEQLGYRYQIIELDYHIYLNLTIDNQTFMIESTDPFYGVIKNPAKYKELVKKVYGPQNGEFYKYNESICKTISIEQLVGLLYFNQAVIKYNNKMFEEAFETLQTAKAHYPGSRMEEFELLILKELHREEIAYMQKP